MLNKREARQVAKSSTREVKETLGAMEVAVVLNRCRGDSQFEIRKKLNKLDARARLAIVSYFEIEPQELAGTVVRFWLGLGRRSRSVRSEGRIDV